MTDPGPMTDPGKPFRAIAPYLGDFLAARMLATALEMGVIDALPATRERLATRFALAPRGLDLMLALLGQREVLAERDGAVALTDSFRAALEWRDLIELRLAFADLVLPDVATLLGPFIQDSGEFLARSAVFDLFRYDRAGTLSPEDLGATRRWVRLTTGLTRYESAGLLALHRFAPDARVLDIGGNSGEMARALCAAYPGIQATVFDLPAVCELGRAHLKDTPEAARIRFAAGDMRRDALPGGMDAAILKSVLHDWPDEDACRLLDAAAAALKPGGRIVIFERLPFDLSQPLGYADIAILMFLHHLRGPALYRAHLEKRGLAIVAEAQITLDMPFFLLAAQKL
jgi:SAM-dependent methyltransferase